jgi:ribonuclease-3
MQAKDQHSFEKHSGISFNDKSLLTRALTHPSYLNEHPTDGLEDNQRLEFLGDAVLDFVSAELLYHRFPEASEGQLTRLRAALVRTETLARFARDHEVGPALQLGRGEQESGGRNRRTNLCAAFEALMGALYLDQGMGPVREYVLPLFEDALEDVISGDLDKDAKSRLQEWSQANLNTTPSYQTIGSRGPDHAKEFTVAVYLDGELTATGNGGSKQAAAQAAAAEALARLLDPATDQAED